MSATRSTAIAVVSAAALVAVALTGGPALQLSPKPETVKRADTLALKATLKDARLRTYGGKALVVWQGANATVTPDTGRLVRVVPQGSGPLRVVATWKRSDGKLVADTLNATVPRDSTGAPPASSALLPRPGDRILMDTRQTLQQATTLAQAIATLGKPDIAGTWNFTTDVDGQGTHAFRYDWPNYNGTCADRGPMFVKYLPQPLATHVMFSWTQRMGRTATGGGIGDLNAFQITNPKCGSGGNASRKMFLVLREVPDHGGAKRVDVIMPGPAPVQYAITSDGLNFRANPIPGTNFYSQQHVGEKIVHTLELKAESAPGAGDGVVRLWINGTLVVENTRAPIGAEAFHRFQWPSVLNSPSIDMTEYFWDVVSWVPSDSVLVPPTTPVPPSTGGTGYDALTYGPGCVGVGGSTGTPLVCDIAGQWTSDSAWRTSIFDYGQVAGNPLYAATYPTKKGTQKDKARAIYVDGVNPDLLDWVATAGPGSTPAFRATVLALNLPKESRTPQPAARGFNKHGLWLWVRRRYDPLFEAYGNPTDSASIAWNKTQGAGFKIGPYASYGYRDSLVGVTYYGRAGVQSGNGWPTGIADISLVNGPQGTPQPGTIGDINVGKITTEWQDGVWRDWLAYVGNVDSSGTIYLKACAWERKLGEATFTRIGTCLARPMGSTSAYQRPRFTEIMPFMLNANRSRSTDLHFYVWGWAAWDAEQYPDPFGVR